MALPPFLTSVIQWLRAGYPEGVPDVDYIPLFALLANTGVRYLGDPTREGAGLPDLQRAGLNAAPQAGVQTASAGPQPSNAMGNLGRFQTFDAGPQFGSPGFSGNVPFVAAGGIVPSFNGLTGIDPATFQRLVQLRAAGLL